MASQTRTSTDSFNPSPCFKESDNSLIGSAIADDSTPSQLSRRIRYCGPMPNASCSTTVHVSSATWSAETPRFSLLDYPQEPPGGTRQRGAFASSTIQAGSGTRRPWNRARRHQSGPGTSRIRLRRPTTHSFSGRPKGCGTATACVVLQPSFMNSALERMRGFRHTAPDSAVEVVWMPLGRAEPRVSP